MTAEATAANEAAPLGVRAVLHLPDYRRIAAAQFISDFGDALTNLALLLVINQLTGSLGALALMAIVLAAPAVTIGVVAGAWVDRLEPRRVMLASDLIRGVLVLGLILVHSADMVWLLYLLGFLAAAVSTFFAPARITLVSLCVPQNGLMAANSLSQGGRIVAQVLGTGAAGVLVSLANTSWPAFAVDSLTFVLSFVLVLGVVTRRAPESNEASANSSAPAVRPSIVREVREGIGVVSGSPQLIAIIVAAAAMMLGLGAVNVLFVPLLVNDLQVSPAWFGAVDAAQTAGMILAAALLAVRLAGVRPGTIVAVGMVGLAVFTALMAAVNQVWQVVLLLFAVGWVITPLQASVTTLVQTATDPKVRGRVAGLLNSSVTAASVVSMAFAGLAGQAFSARAVFVLCALIIGGGALIAAWLFGRSEGGADYAAAASGPAPA